CAPLPAASSTNAETAAMFSCSSAEPRASCRAATVILVMGRYLVPLRPRTSALWPLSEEQRHPIAFADRIKLRTPGRAFGRAAISGWQGPDAALPVGLVLRIGVDLALGDEIEAIGVEQRNDVLLALIAVVAECIACWRIRLGAVLDDSEQTIVLEQLARDHERIVQPAEASHVVNLAKNQEPVRGACKRIEIVVGIGAGRLRAFIPYPAARFGRKLLGGAPVSIPISGHFRMKLGIE